MPRHVRFAQRRVGARHGNDARTCSVEALDEFSGAAETRYEGAIMPDMLSLSGRLPALRDS